MVRHVSIVKQKQRFAIDCRVDVAVIAACLGVDLSRYWYVKMNAISLANISRTHFQGISQKVSSFVSLKKSHFPPWSTHDNTFHVFQPFCAPDFAKLPLILVDLMRHICMNRRKISFSRELEWLIANPSATQVFLFWCLPEEGAMHKDKPGGTFHFAAT